MTSACTCSSVRPCFLICARYLVSRAAEVLLLDLREPRLDLLVGDLDAEVGLRLAPRTRCAARGSRGSAGAARRTRRVPAFGHGLLLRRHLLLVGGEHRVELVAARSAAAATTATASGGHLRAVAGAAAAGGERARAARSRMREEKPGVFHKKDAAQGCPAPAENSIEMRDCREPGRRARHGSAALRRRGRRARSRTRTIVFFAYAALTSVIHFVIAFCFACCSELGPRSPSSPRSSGVVVSGVTSEVGLDDVPAVLRLHGRRDRVRLQRERGLVEGRQRLARW